MPHVTFFAGQMFDYYSGGTYIAPVITGFPLVDRNDFDSEVYVSPAINVPLADLVNLFWNAKSFSVDFSDYAATGPATQEFPANATDEWDIIDGVTFESDSDTGLRFGLMGIVINSAGEYGLQCQINDPGGSPVFNLTSVSGETLYFESPEGADPERAGNATATVSAYWDYV